jgi:glutamate synthase domain-containing protein 1
MCGIVGVLIKKPSLRGSLGQFVAPMLSCMGERGADSAGLAVFSEPLASPLRRFSLYAPGPRFAWKELHERLLRDTGIDGPLESTENHAVLTSTIDPPRLKSWLKENDPGVRLLSAGRCIDVYKDTGHPDDLERRYAFSRMKGSHAVGHTRMATESAVSPAHSHPFTAGEDFCLVHNGSLSNPYSVRRRLEKKGIQFETDNDTEAACRFLEWRMRAGDTLERAITTAFEALDGFYTLLMATAQKLTLVRDAFACKPAVVAETDDYVAISSEFRSLAHLPGVKQARLFEPAPEKIYSWSV